MLDRATVSWASTDTRTWAPDMVYRNGKYYFYTAIATSVGVAVCDSPVGPCRDKGSPLVQGQLFNGVEAIDPMVFVTTTARRTCTSAAPPAAAPWASSGSTPTWSPSAAR